MTTPEALEFPAIQRVLERNAWLLGDEYELWTANRTMQRIVEDYAAMKYEGSHGKAARTWSWLAWSTGTCLLS